MAEGRRTIDELARHGLSPRLVVAGVGVADHEVPEVADGGRVLRVHDDVVASVADSQTPQGVIAEFDRPAERWPDDVDLAVVLDGLSDPGNVGTIIRSAAAFRAAVAVVTPGADPWSPKVVRAAVGAHAVVPIISGGWDDIADRCAARSLVLVGLDGAGDELAGHGRRAWVVGNEAHGLSAAALEAVDHLERIPTESAVESLNAATAASIVLAARRLGR